MSLSKASQRGPVLSIQLFGRFVVRIDGDAVDDKAWGRRSAMALVKVLALESSRALHREQVIERLWPALGARAANNSLNKAIHAARRALEPGLKRGADSRYILTPESQIVLASPGLLRIDVQQFEQGAHHALRERDADVARSALGLYAGTLLNEDLYADWTFAHRDLMQRLFHTTSMFAAQQFAERGEPAKGIEVAQRLILEDPGDEAADRLLRQLYASAGRNPMAAQPGQTAPGAADLRRGADWQLFAGTDDGIVPSGGDRPADTPPPAVAASVDVAWIASAGASGWSPHIEPISFRRGIVSAARWCPDSGCVVFSADWDGSRFGLYRLYVATDTIEQLPWNDVELMAISPRGELALGLNRKPLNSLISRCTLSVATARGGPATEVLDDVQWADWHPVLAAARPADPKRALAVVREIGARSRLEFPIGTVLFESPGWISHPRFSPCGRHLAFFDHPIANDDEADLRVIDLDSSDAGSRALSCGLDLARGLAWRDDAVWFTAARSGLVRSLYRVDLAGREQRMHHGLGQPRLQDAGPDGELLVADEKRSVGTISRHASESFERDISWHEHTSPRDISADGRWLLVEESNAVGRYRYSAWLRRIDGTTTRALGHGVPLVLAPDQRTAILRIPGPRSQLALLDLDTLQRRLLRNDGPHPLVHNEFVSFFPDGRRIAFWASDAQGGPRIYFQDLDGGKPECFTPDEPGVRMPWNRAVSPDGRSLLLLNADDRMCLYPIDGGPAVPLPGLGAEARVAAWHVDGQQIFVYASEGAPIRVDRYHLMTGVRREWMTLSPAAVGPVDTVTRLRMTADGLSYAYVYTKEAADLYRFDDA